MESFHNAGYEVPQRMKRNKISTLIRIVAILALALVVYLGLNLRSRYFLKQNFWQKRPPAQAAGLYDYARILEDINESTSRFLDSIQRDYAIEMVIVTVPNLPPDHTIQSLAAALFSNWEIGQISGGRGILLMLADKEKLIKIEVSYELEHVFTDIFCGYIEDKQLKSYFLSNQLNIGLVAVLEEIEQRAQVRQQADFTVAEIDRLDRELLSGGAGATRQLTEFEPEKISTEGTDYPAGRTPDEAWRTLIRSWEDKVRDPNLGVYTQITRLAYRDFRNLPDSRYEENVLTYKNKPYKVIQDDPYAVIYFGKDQGWANAPFLFCRTESGWQFNIVHQRKYVRMGKAPRWGIERSDYPYAELLSGCPYWMNQDIPLQGSDIYHIENDLQLANEILRLEAEDADQPENFQTVMQLGRLYTITSLSPQKRLAYLKKSKQLDPESPEPYKYLAIVYLDAFYQFETAIQELTAYTAQRPDDVFGRNYLGYLYLCIKKYKQAANEFNKAIELQSDNCYAYAKLARAYTGLFLNSAEWDPRRSHYRSKALEMYAMASSVPTPNERRLKWLQRYLVKKGVME